MASFSTVVILFCLKMEPIKNSENSSPKNVTRGLPRPFFYSEYIYESINCFEVSIFVKTVIHLYDFN